MGTIGIKPLETRGNHQEPTETMGNYRKALETTRKNWKPLVTTKTANPWETTRNYCELLVATGNP